MLKKGTVSTNCYLRKTHNFALDMNWLPATVIPRRQWPAIRFKDKRAITLAEHEKIVAAEVNPERKTLYRLCWHLGASQGDIAALKGEDVDSRTTNYPKSWTHRASMAQKTSTFSVKPKMLFFPVPFSIPTPSE